MRARRSTRYPWQVELNTSGGWRMELESELATCCRTHIGLSRRKTAPELWATTTACWPSRGFTWAKSKMSFMAAQGHMYGLASISKDIGMGAIVIVVYKPMARPAPPSHFPFPLIYFHTQMWEFSCNCLCVWTRGNLYKIARITYGCVQSAADFVACFLGHLVNAISFGHTHRAHRLSQSVCVRVSVLCGSVARILGKKQQQGRQ